MKAGLTLRSIAPRRLTLPFLTGAMPRTRLGWWLMRFFRRLSALVLAGGTVIACASPGGAGPGASATIDPARTESPWSAKCEKVSSEAASDPSSELTIVAPVGAAACGFDTTRLVAWAGQPLTIEFVDEDSTMLHNFAIYRDPDRAEPVATSAWLLAPQRETLRLPAIAAGTYYFYCDLQQRTMFGTLTAVASVP